MNLLVSIEVAEAIERSTGYYRRIIEERSTRVATNYAAREAFRQLGMRVDICQFSPENATIDVSKEDLIKVARLIGPLKVDHGTDVLDTRLRRVRVKRGASAFPGLQVRFEHTLPRGSRCKIQKVRHKAHSYTTTSVVCGVSA